MTRPAVGLALLWAVAAAAQAPLPQPYEAKLRDLRTSHDASARAWAAVALGHGLRIAASPGPHPRIIEALNESVRSDSDPTVRAMAAYALCVLGDAAGVAPLIEALRRQAASGRDARDYFDERVAVPVSYLYRSLGVVGGPTAREFLVRTARDGERGARVVAISVFERTWTTDAEVDRMLQSILRERDPAVRAAATWAIEERARSRREAPPR
jgi:hypothetical protein